MVTAESNDIRSELAKSLRKAGYKVVFQEEFVGTGDNTLIELSKYLHDESAVVVHIMGQDVGRLPPEREIDVFLEYIGFNDLQMSFPELGLDAYFRKLSYTQWEAWMALFFNKLLLTYHRTDLADVSATSLLNVDTHFQKLKPYAGWPSKVGDEALTSAVLAALSRISGRDRYDRANISYDDRRKLDLLSEQMQFKWIDDFLPATLRTTKPISGNLVEQRSLVGTSRSSDGYATAPEIVSEFAASQLPRMFKVFGKRLLILGEMGAGKTTRLTRASAHLA